MKLWTKVDRNVICKHNGYKVLCRKCEVREYEKIIKELKAKLKKAGIEG